MELAPANLQRISEPIIVLDVSGVIVAANLAGMGMLGASASGAVGRPAIEYPVLAGALESLHRSGCRLADIKSGNSFVLTLSGGALSGSATNVEVRRVTGGGPFAVALLFRPVAIKKPEPANPSASVSPGVAVPARKKRVLVTDDDAMVRKIVTAVLRHQGFAVVEAQDGEEALERWRSEPNGFDLALLDLHMPRLGGLEVLERLRMLDPGLKVILLSGNLGDTADDQIPGVHYQPKPFQNEELIRLVRQALAE